jgi:cytochrome b6-f complex iron-sulfur subunit
MAGASRRDFLKLVREALLWLSTSLGLGGLIRFLDYDPYPAPKTKFDLGPAEQYPPGTRTMLVETPALLIHKADGFSALSLVCTHLGCTLEQDDLGFRCPCHGSRFDAQGDVTHGPAVKPLRSLRLETSDENHILLYTDDSM